jgi:hypothetical protein
VGLVGDRHHKHVAQGAGLLEVDNVTRVDKVERAMALDDAFPGLASRLKGCGGFVEG